MRPYGYQTPPLLPTGLVPDPLIDGGSEPRSSSCSGGAGSGRYGTVESVVQKFYKRWHRFVLRWSERGDRRRSRAQFRQDRRRRGGQRRPVLDR